MLETVERFEEDLTDVAPVHAPIRAVIGVGEAIEVSPVRERGAEADPVMVRIRAEMESMLGDLAGRRRTPSGGGRP